MHSDIKYYLINNCEKCYIKEKCVMGETSSENPACLVAGSGEAFLMQFELICEGSKLGRGQGGLLKVLGEILPPRGLWQCLETFWVVMTGVWGGIGATGMYWVEARDSAKYPTVRSTGPTAKIIQPQMLIVLRPWNPCESLEVGLHLRR